MNKLIGFDNEFELVLNNLTKEKINNSILLYGNKGIGKSFFTKKLIQQYIKKKK